MPELKTKKVPRLQSEYKSKAFTPGASYVISCVLCTSHPWEESRKPDAWCCPPFVNSCNKNNLCSFLNVYLCTARTALLCMAVGGTYKFIIFSIGGTSK